ncbi:MULTISPECIES: N-acetyltransferase family protein [unclassified Corynebacterium]|uniref:GNAT family N-acetyltransferase n=1 Tax=unclassified Corynebacterium TaxID=2624378 RepID=UPI003306D951
MDGGALLSATIDAAREAGKHVLVVAIEGSNEGSIALHKKYGFQRVGLLPQVGTKNGRWLDMMLMQVMLTDGQPPARPRVWRRGQHP